LRIVAAVPSGAPGRPVDALQDAAGTLKPIAGPLAGLLFGISLLASGLSSSTVGTMAGQGIMEGFIGYRVPLFLRRGISLIPALVIIAIGLDPLRILVLSQV